ncbi:hypothetical protein BD779DRAFT_510711 [Infundibulicybe gibba]|nr:hypothetical protein BD779DRAFT_510711 [Infundibulicybe gibba]
MLQPATSRFEPTLAIATSGVEVAPLSPTLGEQSVSRRKGTMNETYHMPGLAHWSEHQQVPS